MDGESVLMPYGSAVNGSPRWRPSSASRRRGPRRLTAQARLRRAPPQGGEGQLIGQKRNLRKPEFELQKGTAGKRPAVHDTALVGPHRVLRRPARRLLLATGQLTVLNGLSFQSPFNI